MGYKGVGMRESGCIGRSRWEGRNGKEVERLGWIEEEWDAGGRGAMKVRGEGWEWGRGQWDRWEGEGWGGRGEGGSGSMVRGTARGSGVW